MSKLWTTDEKAVVVVVVVVEVDGSGDVTVLSCHY